MAVGADEIIKHRLLIEGDGGNDEKRISNLLKTFVKWCNTTDSQDDSDTTFMKMVSVLAQCQLTMQKSLQVFNMNLKEQQNYENLSNEIENQIVTTHKDIDECKVELQTARCVRKNKQEYDVLAKVIQQSPDREETIEHLKTLEQELLKLNETRLKFQAKLDMRKKQFYVLVSSIHELQSMLEEESESSDEAENECDMMDTS